MDRIKEIKSKLSIYDVATAIGISLSIKNPQKSPFREDKHPSFSISKCGKFFKDFSTGEKGDIFNFYMLAIGCTMTEAIMRLNRTANLGLDYSLSYEKRTKVIRSIKCDKGSICLPKIYWNCHLAQKLCDQRGYSIESQRIAHERGIFGFCLYKDHTAWVVTDRTKKSAQVRRLDGRMWKHSNGEHKAETIKNSDTSYPIGLSEARNMKNLALCEGSSDLLAAFHFAYIHDCNDEIAPLCMLGAHQRIGESYLRAFNNKNVLIFPDADKAGKSALQTWGNALSACARSVRYFDYENAKMFDGNTVKDLSDFIKLDYGEWESIRPFDNPFISLMSNN